jgi:hypothetical protein
MHASEDKPWAESYVAAMLELDPQSLPERIAVAKKAVQLRIKEIDGWGNHHAERQQIVDALNGLRML